MGNMGNYCGEYQTHLTVDSEGDISEFKLSSLHSLPVYRNVVFSGGLFCSLTLEDVLDRADLSPAERDHVQRILLGESFGLTGNSRNFTRLASEMPSGLVNAGFTVREANALLAVVPGNLRSECHRER